MNDQKVTKPSPTFGQSDRDAQARATYRALHRRCEWFLPLARAFAAATAAGHDIYDILQEIECQPRAKEHKQ